MADRTVSVRLQALVSGYVAGMRTAAKSTEDFAIKNKQELEKVGRGLLVVGGAAVSGLGLATKAAIDWESAWAGVQKTVDGTASEMAVLEGELRDMAKSLPATHDEIAAVAEAAGQLGVKREDIADFTRTMIDLGETTNLTATEAATNIARFTNIMGTATSDVDRLGSVLVDLGNNSATTEREILEFSTRLAAAGNIAGLSESDVLAFGAALTSVGVEAEAGGTALSKTFISIRDAVLTGGDQLETFARVAGTTSADFAASFKRDPAAAIAEFIAGLGRMNDAGESTTGVLGELELTDQRLMRALLSTAGAGDLLTDSLELGNVAWEENTALSEEAAERYRTAAAQISMAWSSIRDAAIEVGSVVAPIVAGIAGVVGDLADAFGELPEGVDIAVASILGLVGLVGTAGGALLLFAPRIVETKRAMEQLAAATGATGTAIRGLGKVARAAGVIGALLLIAQGIQAVREASRDAPPEIGETTKALLDLADGLETSLISDLQQLHQEIIAQRESTQEAKNSWTEYKDSVVGTDLGNIVEGNREFAEQIGAVDTALAQMVAGGNLEEADDAVHALANALGLSKGEIDTLLGVLPEYADQLDQADADQRLAGDSADEAAGAWEDEATALEKATDALAAYRDELRAMTDPVFAVMSALENVETAQSAYNDAVEEHGEKSEEARQASVDLAEAVAGMEQAVLDGDLSWEDFDSTLKRWVDQGIITAEQAETIRDSTDEAREAAEDYEGDYAAELKVERDKAEEREAQRKLDEIAAEREAIMRAEPRNLTVVDGQLNRIARERTAAIRIAISTSRGSALSPGGVADGGLITATGVQRFPGGGFVSGPGGPREDRIPAMLSDGEFVVNAGAVQQVGLDTLRAINNGQTQSGASIDPRALARAMSRAIDGATLVIDDRGRGRLIARQADLIGRTG